MCIAAILAPRYKMKIMEFYYQKVYGRSRGSKEIEKIKKIFYDLLAKYDSENSDEEASCSVLDICYLKIGCNIVVFQKPVAWISVQ